MDDTQSRLQKLEDLEAIRNLIASYGPLADAGDATGLAALWTEDGVYDVGGFGIASGHTELAALIESATHRQLMVQGCAHVLSPHHIEIDGEAATATGYSTVYVAQGSAIVPWRVSHNCWHLVRQADGRWLVSSRINRPLSPS